jgi:DNA polymerase (family 10)
MAGKTDPYFTNKEIAGILFEMAALWEMQGVNFKPRAYEKAALQIESLNESVKDIYDQEGLKGLTQIPSIGESIAKHIEELIKTGHFHEYEAQKKRVPVNLTELLSVEGVGPHTIRDLWRRLHIKNLADLEKACIDGKISKLPHFGRKSEEKILKGIEFLKRSKGRQILGDVLPEIRKIETLIRSLPGVEEAVVAGSVRRMKETIGDIDIVVVSSSPEKIMDRFVDLPMVEHVYGKGPTKTNVRLKNGVDADLRVVPKRSFGAALLYFTGSKEHNIALREMAVQKGWKLNEYGLFRGKKVIAGCTEEDIYDALGLSLIPPELRENSGEFVIFGKGVHLPELVNYGDLKGDLQTQTNWTDGEDTIEDMAGAAMALGLEYIAITDHTKSLAMTSGCDEKKLACQMKEIDEINAKLKKKHTGFRILKGAEVNILRDGALDISDDCLAKLDVVGAAVHSHFELSREAQTERVIRAIQNPNVDILFHPTGRILNKRDAISLDMDKIMKVAKKTGTILEIDSIPDRLDLKDEYIRKCSGMGVKMCIDSDAHSRNQFAFLEFGIAQARRGWAERTDIVNTLPLQQFLRTLK